MKEYVVTSSYGNEHRYQAENVSDALRQFTNANPGVAVLSVVEGTEVDAQDSMG